MLIKGRKKNTECVAKREVVFGRRGTEEEQMSEGEIDLRRTNYSKIQDAK